MKKMLKIRIFAVLLAVITAVYSCNIAVFADDSSEAVAENAGEADGLSDDEAAAMNTEAAVAKIGDTTYTSLEDALDAALQTSGSAVVLLQDTTLSKEYVINTELTIDLKGYDITGSGNSRLFTVDPSAKLFLLDTAGDNYGSLQGGNAGTENGGAVYVSNGATLVLQDLFIVNNRAALGGGIYADTGATIECRSVVYVHNNYDNAEKSSNLYLKTGVYVTCPNVQAPTAIGITTEEYGNSFASDVTKGTADYFFSDNSDYVVAFNSDKNELYLAPSSDKCQCRIGEVYYDSLERALQTVQDGDEIVLLKDITLSQELYYPTGLSSLSIELNGHTLSAAGNTEMRLMTIDDAQSLTVKDSSYDKTGKISNFGVSFDGGAFFVKDGGSLTLENVEISDCNAANGAAVYLNKDSELILKGKTEIINNIKADESGNNIFMENGALIKTDGLDLESHIGFSVKADDVPDQGAKLTIAQDISETKTDISGCFTYQPLAETRGCGIYLDTTEAKLMLAPYSAITYHVNGGTMPESYTEKYIEGQIMELPVPTQGDLTFSGWCRDSECAGDHVYQTLASYTGDLEFYALWSGSSLELIHDGQTTCYRSFENAYNASAAGDTIRLLGDVTLEQQISVFQTLTIDLNGHTLTGCGTSRLFKILGSSDAKTTLVVRDSQWDDGNKGTITGGREVSDSPQGMGGNFYVGSNGILVIQSGTISDGCAQLGGGIYIADGGEVDFFGGAINNNTALNGGGVFVAAGGRFDSSKDKDVQVTMTGNKAVTSLSEQEEEAQSASFTVMAAELVHGVGSALYLQEGGYGYFGNININGNIASVRGAVYADNPAEGDFICDQAATCTGNKTPDGKDANVYLDGGKMCITDTIGAAGGAIGFDGSQIMGVSIGAFIVVGVGAVLGTFLTKMTSDDPDKNVDTGGDGKDPEVKYNVAWNTTKDKKYARLQLAFEEASEGDDIVLLTSVSEAAEYDGAGITFSPAGFALNGALVNSGTMTIYGTGTINGAVTNQKDSSALIINGEITLNGGLIVEDGTCTLTTGTITAVTVNKGNFNMTGGTLTTLKLLDKENSAAGDIAATISGGTIESAGSCITVNAKQASLIITGADTKINGLGSAAPAILLEAAASASIKGASVTSSGVAVEIKKSPLTIGDNATIISSAADAITLETDSNDDVITINGGIIKTSAPFPDMAGVRVENGNVVMNGGEVTSLFGSAFVIEAGLLTVTQGKINSTATTAPAIEAGGFKEEENMITSAIVSLANCNVDGSYGVYITSGQLTVLEGARISGNSYSAIAIGGDANMEHPTSASCAITKGIVSGYVGGIEMNNSSVLTVADSNISTVAEAAIEAQGGSITLSGTTIVSSQHGAAIEAGALQTEGAGDNYPCVVTIGGTCSLTSSKEAGVCVSYGSLKLDGNVLISSTDGHAVEIGGAASVEIGGNVHLKAEGTVEEEGAEEEAAKALCIESTADNVITGGLFEGEVEGYVKLSGGYFTNEIEMGGEEQAYTAPGYILSETTDEQKTEKGSQYNYCVKEGKYTAGVGRVSGSSKVGTIEIKDKNEEACNLYDFGDHAFYYAPEVPGYNFVGWFSDRIATRESYLDDENEYECEITGNTTVYAYYQPTTGAAAELKVEVQEDHPVKVQYYESGAAEATSVVLSEDTTLSPALNTNVTLEPVNDWDTNVNWVDGNDQLISTGRTCITLMSYARTIKMKVFNAEEGKINIYYTAKAGNSNLQTLAMCQIECTTDVTIDDIAAAIVDNQPAVPIYDCYVFGGWHISFEDSVGNTVTVTVPANDDGLIDQETVANRLVYYDTSHLTDLTVEAYYVMNSGTFSIRYHYLGNDGQDIKSPTLSSSKWTVGQHIIMTQDETIMVSTGELEWEYSLDHWEYNGVVISYGTKAVIRPLTTVEDSVVDVYLVYTLLEPHTDDAVVATTGLNKRPVAGVPKIAITLSYALPEGCTLNSAGYLVGYGTKEEADMYPGDDGVRQASSTTLTEPQGIYTLNVSVQEKENDTYTFRPYVIYTDADGKQHTLYGAMTTTSYSAIEQ